MAQSKVTSYYNTRKRRTDNKSIKDNIQKQRGELSLSLLNYDVRLESKFSQSAVTIPAEPGAGSNSEKTLSENIVEIRHKAGNVIKSKPVSRAAKKTKAKRGKSKDVCKPTTESDIRAVFGAQALKAAVSVSQTEEKLVNEKANEETVLVNSPVAFKTAASSVDQNNLLRTPKRNLSDAEEPKLCSKKKKQQQCDSTSESSASTPEKDAKVEDHSSVRKKLALHDDTALSKAHEAVKASSPQEDAFKSLSSEKRNELKEQLKKFNNSLQKFKEYKSNKFKITSVILPESKKNVNDEDTKVKTTPAYQKFSYLSTPGTPTLSLPYKYKLLLERFSCSDIVVRMLYNRKETCRFNTVKNNVENMMKTVFTKNHLGQFKTVFPSAYDFSIAKNPPAFINRNPGTPLYELIMYPNLLNQNTEYEDYIDEKSEMVEMPNKEKSSPLKNAAFVPMDPVHLVRRKKKFYSCLMNIVKKHHQDFLSKLNPPIHVPMDKLTKWHPKFPVDSIPDIEVSALPELPDQQKVSSAKDVLNKIRGTKCEKIEKALQIVADKYASVEKSSDTPPKPVKVTCGLLKGISLDILERIRARESIKIVEDMTRKPEDMKRKEMLERIPEFVRILRTYFITERKAAVSLEDATKKLVDSCRTAINPDYVHEHLQLMAKIFPNWISLIPVQKGMFLKIDKNKDINILLNNMPKQ